MARPGPLPVDPIAEAKRQWTAHGWTDAAPGMSAVTSIIRAQQLMLARIDAALKPFGLSFARYEMLRLLGFTREGRMPMASAIARLQVHPTSVTNTVDRLVRDGLVECEPHPGDGRAAMLVLTASGRWGTSHAAIPATATRIAVLDRTKEPGSLGEPLFLDVLAALSESHADGERELDTHYLGAAMMAA